MTILNDTLKLRLKTKGVNIMENTQNRSDIQNFFIDMKTDEQNKAIRYLQKIIKKPPETKEAEKKEVIS